MSSLLDVRNLSIEFATAHGLIGAVRDVSFQIGAGEVLGLVGESGSGKSVSALAILRLLPPQARLQGSIQFRGEELLTIPDPQMRHIRGAGISVIFQEPMTALNPVMRVGDQIAEAVLAHAGAEAPNGLYRADAGLKARSSMRAEPSTRAESSSQGEVSTRAESSLQAKASTRAEASTRTNACTKAEASTRTNACTKAEASTRTNACTKAEAWRRAVEALRTVSIPDADRRARDYPHQLSGGQRQRVMIAMAIVNRPALLIADEPTTALDVTIQAQVLELLSQLRHEFSLAMLFISHDLAVVSQVSHRIGVMYAGSLVEMGTAKDVFHNPAHPYTRGLLNSVPTLRSDRARPLQTIEGTVPPISALPPGCAFEPRCELRIPTCSIALPPLIEVSPGHLARCPVVMPEVR